MKRKRKKPATMLMLDEDLVKPSAAVTDPLQRRCHSLSRQFERFQKELPKDHIIRYEGIVSTGGKALAVIIPAASELDEPLSNKNLNDLYDQDNMLRLGERLRQSEGTYWDFYSRAEVEEILGQIS